MRNYAEELAYWYFRLNGFFPLTDYVNHKEDREDSSHSSDTDIVAIRPPFPKEVIGTNSLNDHCEVLRKFVLDKYHTRFIGVICEVKAGDSAFEVDEKNLVSQIKRLGLYDFDTDGQPQLKEVKDILIKKPCFDEGPYPIYKFIITRQDYQGKLPPNYFPISIEQMLGFMLSNRIKTHATKHKAWDKYSSPIFQFLLRHGGLIDLKK